MGGERARIISRRRLTQLLCRSSITATSTCFNPSSSTNSRTNIPSSIMVNPLFLFNRYICAFINAPSAGIIIAIRLIFSISAAAHRLNPSITMSRDPSSAITMGVNCPRFSREATMDFTDSSVIVRNCLNRRSRSEGTTLMRFVVDIFSFIALCSFHIRSSLFLFSPVSSFLP